MGDAALAGALALAAASGCSVAAAGAVFTRTLMLHEQTVPAIFAHWVIQGSCLVWVTTLLATGPYLLPSGLVAGVLAVVAVSLGATSLRQIGLARGTTLAIAASGGAVRLISRTTWVERVLGGTGGDPAPQPRGAGPPGAALGVVSASSLWMLPLTLVGYGALAAAVAVTAVSALRGGYSGRAHVEGEFGSVQNGTLGEWRRRSTRRRGLAERTPDVERGTAGEDGRGPAGAAAGGAARPHRDTVPQARDLSEPLLGPGGDERPRHPSAPLPASARAPLSVSATPPTPPPTPNGLCLPSASPPSLGSGRGSSPPGAALREEGTGSLGLLPDPSPPASLPDEPTPPATITSAPARSSPQVDSSNSTDTSSGCGIGESAQGRFGDVFSSFFCPPPPLPSLPGPWLGVASALTAGALAGLGLLLVAGVPLGALGLRALASAALTAALVSPYVAQSRSGGGIFERFGEPPVAWPGMGAGILLGAGAVGTLLSSAGLEPTGVEASGFRPRAATAVGLDLRVLAASGLRELPRLVPLARWLESRAVPVGHPLAHAVPQALAVSAAGAALTASLLGGGCFRELPAARERWLHALSLLLLALSATAFALAP